MSTTAWWVAGGSLLLLLVLAAGTWLVTVIVRRSNASGTVDVDTEPYDVTSGGPRPERPEG